MLGIARQRPRPRRRADARQRHEAPHSRPGARRGHHAHRRLKGVRTLDDGSLEIGATTTYAELAEAVDVWAVRPIVAEVASIIADVQVRNRGTIGGNVCLNLPIGHFPPVLVAVGAELTIAGADGERIVPAAEFFETTFTTAVRPGELLTQIQIPARQRGRAETFAAMSAGKESKSIVHVAISLRWTGLSLRP